MLRNLASGEAFLHISIHAIETKFAHGIQNFLMTYVASGSDS